MDRSACEAAGIDVDEVLGRVLGREDVVDRLFAAYLRDGSVAALGRALADGDVDAAERAAHALKGVAANLAMGALREMAVETLALVRAGDLDGASALYPALLDAHRRVVAAIS